MITLSSVAARTMDTASFSFLAGTHASKTVVLLVSANVAKTSFFSFSFSNCSFKARTSSSHFSATTLSSAFAWERSPSIVWSLDSAEEIISLGFPSKPAVSNFSKSPFLSKL